MLAAVALPEASAAKVSSGMDLLKEEESLMVLCGRRCVEGVGRRRVFLSRHECPSSITYSVSFNFLYDRVRSILWTDTESDA